MTVNGQKLPTRQVCERYSISDRTLGRWEKDPNIQFPRPLVINSRRYYELEQLVAWERANAAMMAERQAKKADSDEGSTHRVVHTRA